MSERFPRQFGKYVLLKSLARGGMGEICLAASGQAGGLSKLCVIKKVITEKTDRAKANRFLDEAKVVLRLSHANLVSTFDAGDVNGELYIAMELVEGKDLREIWNRCVRTRTRIPVDVALFVVRETARALAYVHSYGELRLVHRDVAPPNILISYFGEVKLTDFGLARSVLKQEHTAPGVVFGRASYLAPEQARGEIADARTDIYSLGIVLWELLTGQPYLQLAGLDPVTSLSLVRNPKLQPPSSRAPWIAAELDGIVIHALAADRTARFQSADELRRALSDVMAKVAPRADDERVADFLRSLYKDVVVEEKAERERLLAEALPQVAVSPSPAAAAPANAAPAVPSSIVDPSVGSGPERLRSTPAIVADARAESGVSVVSGDGAASRSGVESGASPAPGTDDGESLHASAMRARSGRKRRRPASESAEEQAAADAPTRVWRRPKVGASDDPAAQQTFVGRVIENRYSIQRRIGEGGMGTVYAAEHVEIGKSVAVKILHRVYSGELQLVERFRREARAATRVGHPHIIDVTDFGTTEEGCAYFVMEYLEGMDLADVLGHEGRLEPARAVRIAVQICQALQAAHDASIIHRDLKPENVFLVARGGQADFVKVLDFGIARTLTGDSFRLTNPGMAMGTPEYMAPEQAMGRPADHRTDIYAVGALLYEMLIGSAPFRSAAPDAMLEHKLKPMAPLRGQRSEIPPALDALVVQAMDPNPERRPQSMAEVEYDLTKIVWGRPYAVAELLGLPEGSAERAAPPAGEPLTAPPEPEPKPMRAMDIEAMLEADDSPPPQRRPAVSGSVPLPIFVTPAADPASGPAPGAVPAAQRPSPARMAVVGAAARPMRLSPTAAQPASPLQAPSPPAASASGPAGGPLMSPTRPWTAVDAAAIADAAAVEGNVSLRRPPSRAFVAGMALFAVVGGAAWLGKQGRLDVVRGWFASGGAKPSPAPAPIAPLLHASRTGAAERAPARPFAPAAPSPTAARPAMPHGMPEIVPTPPVDRARAAMTEGNPDEAIALLRPLALRGDAVAKPILADALVASGWKAIGLYHWNLAAQKAREAIGLVDPAGPSHGAHALYGEALYALKDFNAALDQFTRALAESPRDARLKRRVIRSRRQLVHPAAPGDVPSASAEPAAE